MQFSKLTPAAPPTSAGNLTNAHYLTVLDCAIRITNHSFYLTKSFRNLRVEGPEGGPEGVGKGF